MLVHSVPTLSDVAKKTGVPTATVSRCLNTPEYVKESTHRKIKNAVDALRYKQNFVAQVMAAKRTKIIGAMAPPMEKAIFARALKAFQDELRTQNYIFLVANLS